MNENAFKQLEIISKLKDNWNDNNANKFEKILIDKVENILFELNYEAEIFPTAINSIQMEFTNECGDYLEFQIYIDKIECYTCSSSGCYENVFSFIETGEINKYISEFMKCKL